MGKSGFLVHPKAHEAYAATIVRVLQDRHLSKNMGQEARKYVEKYFDIATIAEQNIEFYKKMI